jgi:tetratricopeptide (TPR) repeat protein
MREAFSRFYVPAILGLLATGCAAQQPQPLRGHVSLPGKDWGLVLELPGFVVKASEVMPDGRRYMAAENETTHLVVSVTLEQVKSSSTARPCHESLEQKTKHPPNKIQNVRISRLGDLDVMRYTVPKVGGQQTDQESLYACQFYEGAYIDIHLSKVNYTSTDEPLFTEVINTMHIARVQPSSMDLLQQGSLFYLQHDYTGAIGPYSEALELEKADPKLKRSLWYVLVDNLGMSYGITGNLEKAKETFEYGLSKDPTYPMFYYNLACTHAEMGSATEAENYLRRAFDNKANVVSGESMPDPRKDESFKKLMKNKQFREFVETLPRPQ